MASMTSGRANWAVFALALLLGACVTGEQSVETGTFRSALSGVSTMGYLYRLRNADFEINGPESWTVSSEDYLADSTIELPLQEGSYTIELTPGWFLERQETDGSYTAVDAVLTSESLVSFDIVESETTGVQYSFLADEDAVVIGEGTLSISMTVEEGALCSVGVLVTYGGGALPSEIAGYYVEAFDCAREEGGAWFGGVDYAHCFRKDDGSTWRLWNTGCGWEYGLIEYGDWQRHALTYAGLCSAIPASQLGVEALNTSTFYDGFGDPITGLTSTHCL